MRRSFICITCLFFLTSLHGPLIADQTQTERDQILRKAVDLAKAHDYSGAVKILEQAESDATQQNMTDWEGSVQTFLGIIYQRTGRFSEAEQALNRAVYKWTQLKGSEAPELVGPLSSLGGLYYEAGQFTRAEKLISRALGLQQMRESDPGVIAMIQTNLGNVYFREQKDDLAVQQAEAALRNFAIDKKRGLESARAARATTLF